MIQDYSEQYKNGAYLTRNPSWDEEDASYKANKVLALLKKHPIPVTSIHEVGCGSGEILVELSKKLPNSTSFHGTDISQDAINIAKNKVTNQISFEVADISLNKPTKLIDLMLVMDVIEHVENYFQFLRNIHPTSRYTIFHIPLDMCIWSLFREQMLIESKERVGHIHIFTEDLIKSILTDCGYKIFDQLYTEPTFKPNSLKQKLVESIRKTLFRIHPRFCSKTIGGMSILVLAENEGNGI